VFVRTWGFKSPLAHYLLATAKASADGSRDID